MGLPYKNNPFVCIAGKNEIAVNALKFILSLGFGRESIAACCNRNDDGTPGWQPSLRRFCLNNDIQILELRELYSITNLVFISLEFDRIIRPSLFKSARLYNIHFSLLPAYKGVYTSVFPILHEQHETGVTLHKIDCGIDTGEIIDQVKIEISPQLRSLDLYFLFMAKAKVLFESNFSKLVAGTYTSRPQPAKGSSYFSKGSVDFGDRAINFKASAHQIQTWIRAFNFRPFQMPLFDSIAISHAKVLSQRSNMAAGNVVNSHPGSFDVATIDFDLRLYVDRLEDILDAARNNDVEQLRAFSESGYFFDDWEDHGWTPLVVAAHHNSLNSLEYLIQKGANVNHQNFNGTTVLMYAFTSGLAARDFKCFELLLKAGADYTVRDYRGCNLLDYVERSGDQFGIDYVIHAFNEGPIS